jgi:hypothetical protein
MNRVEKTSFDGSDNEAYEEEEIDESEFRDDFSLSDDEENKQQEAENFEKNEEERDRDFFGDEDYGTL